MKFFLIEDSFNQALKIEQNLLLAYPLSTIIVSNNGKDALVQWDEIQADLVLIDLHMPEMDGLELLSKLNFKQKKYPIVVISSLPQAHYQKLLENMGVKGYAYKDASCYLKCIDAVINNQYGFDEAFRTIRIIKKDWVIDSLQEQERKILKFYGLGLELNEIEKICGISSLELNLTLQSLMIRFSFHSQRELMLFAINSGICND